MTTEHPTEALGTRWNGVGAVGPAADGFEAEEARGAVRQRCRLDATYRPFPLRDDGCRPAWVLDASTEGVLLLVREPVMEGKFPAVKLPERARRFESSQLVKVAWLNPARGSGWVVGCCFVEPLGAEQLKALLG
jgi:hypothetical protein